MDIVSRLGGLRAFVRWFEPAMNVDTIGLVLCPSPLTHPPPCARSVKRPTDISTYYFSILMTIICLPNGMHDNH